MLNAADHYVRFLIGGKMRTIFLIGGKMRTIKDKINYLLCEKFFDIDEILLYFFIAPIFYFIFIIESYFFIEYFR